MDNMEEKKENLIQVDLREIMETSFLDYSMSVIVQRALPDVRDGLKPVHRRILYTMYENALWPEKAYRKCADTVGSVLGRYHPHGDTSVYDALVRLAQDFSMRYMLIDGHGNFGSIDGDPPGCLPLHRGTSEQNLRRDAPGHREGHRGLGPKLRRDPEGAQGAPLPGSPTCW